MFFILIIYTQGCASHPQPGGGSPTPDLAIFENWGGIFFKNYKFYMTHFGLIKLKSSNLLDITIDGYKVINYII